MEGLSVCFLYPNEVPFRRIGISAQTTHVLLLFNNSHILLTDTHVYALLSTLSTTICAMRCSVVPKKSFAILSFNELDQAVSFFSSIDTNDGKYIIKVEYVELSCWEPPTNNIPTKEFCSIGSIEGLFSDSKLISLFPIDSNDNESKTRVLPMLSGSEVHSITAHCAIKKWTKGYRHKEIHFGCAVSGRCRVFLSTAARHVGGNLEFLCVSSVHPLLSEGFTQCSVYEAIPNYSFEFCSEAEELFDDEICLVALGSSDVLLLCTNTVTGELKRLSMSSGTGAGSGLLIYTSKIMLC
eukprot:GHVR01001254.1.p1 GENE.GHVR01001254.1~~GHVR01001254.1.p1  ORF type:complete len:296 (-),score=50.30 GHVR01001254.1:348-1235(-)